MLKTHSYKDARDIPRTHTNVLVFGSNVDGWHGAGVALLAYEYFGAEYGNPAGRQGMSYAIRTKDLKVKKHPSVSREAIIADIKSMYADAVDNPELDFYVPYTATGLNLNFYTSIDMAAMFVDAAANRVLPDNVFFNKDFAKLMAEYISNGELV